ADDVVLGAAALSLEDDAVAGAIGDDAVGDRVRRAVEVDAGVVGLLEAGRLHRPMREVLGVEAAQLQIAGVGVGGDAGGEDVEAGDGDVLPVAQVEGVLPVLGLDDVAGGVVGRRAPEVELPAGRVPVPLAGGVEGAELAGEVVAG